MAIDTPTVSARRQRLAEWITSHYNGSQAAFIADSKINQGELSALLRDKSFGEKRAASLEVAAGMPEGYLVRPLDVRQQPICDIPSPAHPTRALVALGERLAKTDQRTRDAVAELLLRYAQDPVNGTNLLKAIEALLGDNG